MNRDHLEATDRYVKFRKEEIEQSLPERFEQQVEANADRIAARTGTDHASYHSLNCLSNRVAWAILAELGTGEETVALLMEQGIPLIAAILGALKAGKIYVPLDPSYPQSRISTMLEDCQARLVVTDTRNLGLARQYLTANTPLLNVGEVEPDTSIENPRLHLSPDTLAYIFYTSGSTGPPKGVVDNHRNVLHNIMRYSNSLKISPDDRLSLVQSCSFSGSVSSLFGALLNGAVVCLFDLGKRGVHLLADWVLKEEITIFHSVPMIFQALVARGDRFPSLRLIRLEGDMASKRHVELFKQYFDSTCTLVNGLGTTETGLVRQYFINRDTVIPGSAVPIGYPTEDMEVRLLDESGNDVESGESGEIAVRSRYLAVGYWRRADLTATAFQPSPDDDGSRIYCTGDVGRFLADGCLEYLGRKNFQSKFKGHRVETEAIEMSLIETGLVREALVISRDDPSGMPVLVAYLVPAGSSIPTINRLRRALAEKYPDYMIPSRYITLDALPLTSHGKVDRQQLPLPGRERPELETSYTAPRNSLELMLAGIWGEALGIDPVGVHDNFLELGGDSLSAAKIASKVHERLQIDLDLNSFFESPTVAESAERINQCHPGKPRLE